MKKYLITVNQHQYEVEVVEVRDNAHRVAHGTNTSPKVKPSAPKPVVKESKASSGGKKVLAPMPGNVLKVLVAPGDEVKRGQKLLVFEAMKMENDLTSPSDGVVVEVKTSAGSVMATGDVLVIIE